ncbi:uncharacterized protein LOC132727508, partial [Ruditapes philippinarum]|uniref:uncharacterized protein LOC132727508 n=1 Tax=Ruditapes philippinarum TaxID=129788 RepID=UPI00295B0A09
RTNSFLSSQATSDQLYVTSTLHEGAKRKLKHNSFIVICGPPGEGKTTLAAKLMCEIAEPTSRFKLNDPGEWKWIFPRWSNQIVFIDDIFGEGLFRESLLNKWSTVLSEIKHRAKFLILTTRDYILEQAKNKMSMKYLNVFEEKHIHRLSSSALSISEKCQILRAHLRFSKRSCDRNFVEKCVGLYYTSALVGFPEICRLFANNHTLFIKGSPVFENPSHFFKNCIKDIFRDENTFIAMMLIWSRPNKSLNVLDVERKQYSILNVAYAFGYELNNSSKLKVLKAMEFHKKGFLTYNQNTGHYTFCHTIVSDMVGLVAGQEHTGAILEYANEEFIMQYITTDANKNDDFHIFIEEFRFQQLNDNIRRCISITPNPVGWKKPNTGTSIYGTVVTLPTKVKLRQMPLFIGEDTLNAAIVKHDCFNNRKYIEHCLERSSFLSSPVISFRRQFGYYGVDVGDRFLTVNLPLRALLYDNIMLLDVFLKQKTFNYYMQSTKDFFYVGMLIAAHKGLVHAADLLLKHGGKVCEDAIFIAAENSDIRMLSYLLTHRGNDYSFDSNIMNKNSPLIAVAKRGLIPPMKCLLYHGVDINYRNANKASALEKAVLYQQRDACKFLLENGADVNGKGGKYKRTPLHIAADIGAIEIVELLLQHGAEVKIKDCKGHFPIFCAAIQGHAETVDCMLKKDVSQAMLRISSYGRKSVIKGMGLMHVAVWKNDIKLLTILIQNKVNPDSRDFYGRTPFYCAVDSGRTEIMDALLSVSNVKLAEKNGFTPLHTAIHRRHTYIAKQICLLSDINAQDKYGKTALHTACEELDTEIFHLLVMVCGADLRILTKTGNQ